MFVHLWKILLWVCFQFWGEVSLTFIFFFLLPERTGEFWRDSLPTGEFVQLENQRIEPLNCVSTMCALNIQKEDLAPIEVYFLIGGRGRFDFNPKKQKKQQQFPLITRINGWIVSETQMDRFLERKRPCVVTVGPIMWRPLWQTSEIWACWLAGCHC